jgi:SHS2 domain-containing protein
MPPARSSGFEELPHTADWALRVWAPDLPGLFAQAARGMHALSGARPAAGPRRLRTIELQAPDAESLLVGFLSELVFAAEGERLIFNRIKVRLHDPDPGPGLRLSATMSAAPLSSLTRAIKAVTYHNLSIRRTAGGYEVEIVFDV